MAHFDSKGICYFWGKIKTEIGEIKGDRAKKETNGKE